MQYTIRVIPGPLFDIDTAGALRGDRQPDYGKRFSAHPPPNRCTIRVKLSCIRARRTYLYRRTSTCCSDRQSSTIVALLLLEQACFSNKKKLRQEKASTRHPFWQQLPRLPYSYSSITYQPISHGQTSRKCGPASSIAESKI